MKRSSPFFYIKSIIHHKMNIIKTDIDGVLSIDPHQLRDAHGNFFKSFSENKETSDFY